MGLALARKEGFYGWTSVAMGGLVMFMLMGAFLMSFGIFLPILCKEFGWSITQVSGASVMAITLGGVLGPLAGMFISKFGPRRSIVMGNTLMAVGFLVMYFLKDLWQLYVAVGLLGGLGYGFGSFLPVMTIANNWFVKKRTMAMGIVGSAGGIGGLVLVPAIAAMVEHYGWRNTYFFLFIIGLIFMAVIPGIFIRNKPEDLGQVADGKAASESTERHGSVPGKGVYTTPVDFTMKEATRTSAFWLTTFAIVVFMFALNEMGVHQIKFMETIGLTTMSAATAVSVYSGMTVVGSVLLGFLGLRISIWFLSIAFVGVCAAGLAITLITHSFAMALVYNIIFGIGIGAFMAAYMSLFAAYFGRSHYAEIVGVVMPAPSLLGGLGILMAAKLFDKTGSYALPFTITIGLLILAAVALILAPPPKHPSLKN